MQRAKNTKFPNACLEWCARRGAASVEALEQRWLLSASVRVTAKPVSAPSAPPFGLNLVVTNTNTSGSGSLAAAITAANNVANSSISFKIPTTDPGYDPTYHVFNIKKRRFSDVPEITGAGTIIDGATEQTFTGQSNIAGSGPVIDIVYQFDADLQKGDGLIVSASGCSLNDLRVTGFRSGLVISGNGNSVTNMFVGTNEVGGSGAGNVTGIVVSSAQNSLTGNTVSSNTGTGVELTGTAAHDNLLAGNRIGVSALVEAAVPNGGAGVLIHAGASTNAVGQSRQSAATTNVISGNSGAGVEIADSNTGQNSIVGNFIGASFPNSSGSVTAIGNGTEGIYVHDGSTGTAIGKAGDFYTGNDIGANGSDGILLLGAASTGVYNNRIGAGELNPTGLGNHGNGIRIDSGSANQIGQSTSGYGNLAWYNDLAGVAVSSGAAAQTIAGNQVEFNRGDGVTINASSDVVDSNYIQHNQGNGITVGSGSGNQLPRNTLADNGGIGIDLGANGITPNTPGGPHSGANLLQNYPLLRSLSVKGSTVKVGGTLNAAASKLFTIEFYATPSSSSDDPIEADTYIGAMNVVTDSGGNVTFQFAGVIDPATLASPYITATATDSLGNTSELSAPIDVFSVAGGATQRSSVKNFQISFPSKVTLAPGAITIGLHSNVTGYPNGVGVVPNISYTSPDGGKTYLVVVSGPGVVNGSIADGVYDVTVHADKVTPINSVTPTGADQTFTFFRLFGDYNGDAAINNADYFQFRNSFNKPSTDNSFRAFFDYNGDGLVNNGDYFQFRNRFNTALIF